jgi:hypothetical protein
MRIAEKRCTVDRYRVTGEVQRLAGFRPRLAESYERLADCGIGDPISAPPS